MGLIEQILVQGRDSRLFQELVQRRGYTGAVNGGINFVLGNMLNYDGPMLMTTMLIHDADKPADSILAAIDVVIEELRTRPVDAATLERARTKARSSFYSYLESLGGWGRADLLAVFALFDSDPARINRIEDELAKVTPDLIQRTAQEYLRPTNRTILTIEPRKPTP
jgi:predicted Zn-dependent peptidase